VGIVVTGNDNDKIMMRTVYESYLAYCELHSLTPVIKRAFNREVLAAGARRYKSHGDWHLQGVKFIESSAPPPAIDVQAAFYLPHSVQFVR
jgi:hypothetical protein